MSNMRTSPKWSAKIMGLKHPNQYYFQNARCCFSTRMKPYNVLCVQYMDYVPLCCNLTTATSVRGVYSIQQCYYTTHKYHIAENFRGRKLSRISWFVAIHESFLHEIWGLSTHRHGNLRILHENCIFHQFLKVFTLKSYGTISCTAEPKWNYSLIGQLLPFSTLHPVIQWAGVEYSVHSSMPLSVARQRPLWMCSR